MRIVCLCIAIAAFAACSDEPSGGADAAAVDARPDIDGSSECPGQLLFTGDYVDWDSRPDMFLGIFEAEVSEVGNPENSATTAPNGRAILCIPAAVTSTLGFVQGDYLDLVYTAQPDVTAAGPFSLVGLTPTRADALFTGELGLTRDEAAAQVLIAVYDYDEVAPATGATVSLGNASQGAFVDDGTGTYVAGDTVGAVRFVFFANVAIEAGSTDVQVADPTRTCSGPDSLPLAAGQIAATTFSCR